MSGSEQQMSAGGMPQALCFPVEAEVPETKRHLELRTLLYQFLKLGFSERAAIGCDQFVYWDPSDPRACLAPDGFVRFGEVNDLFPSWKVWERGVPQVAIEIVSDSDESERGWQDKLERYRHLGVAELVRFDPESRDRPLRVWDLVGDELSERQVDRPGSRSRFLDGFWLAVADPASGLALRLSHDEQGQFLYPTPGEQEAEGRRAEAEGRRTEAEGRRAAEERVRELEAELRKRIP
jgi:Uma2 family endonuclease